jgi:hypothetical protein
MEHVIFVENIFGDAKLLGAKTYRCDAASFAVATVVHLL